ncbi:MAG: HlyD family secretion protein [Cellulosilyticaceae bacterium]
MWNGYKKYAIVMLSLGMSLMVGCEFGQKEQPQNISPAHQEAANIEVIDVDGEVIASDTQTMTLECPGRITTVFIKEGQIVSKDDPLMALDLTSYLSQITLKENELEVAKIKLTQLQQTLNPQVVTLNQLKNTWGTENTKMTEGTAEQLLQLQNALRLAQEAEVLAKEDYEAAAALDEVGAISANELKNLAQIHEIKMQETQNLVLQISEFKDKQKTTLDELMTQIKSQEALLSNVERDKEAQLAMSTKEVESLEILVQDMQDKIHNDWMKDSTIIAPKDQMIVTEVMGKPGMQLQQVTTPLITLVDQGSLSIEIKIPEEYSGDIKVGQEVQITPVGVETGKFQTKIKSIAYQVEESYGENIIRAELELLPKDMVGLRLGQSIEAQIICHNN